MKKEALRVTSIIPVAPTTLYFAWIDSEHHSSMTGATAKIEPSVGSKYSACNGYVSGKLVILDLGRRIVMTWRTSDFPREATDSRVEVNFETFGPSTRILILHTDIPEGQSEQYKALWNEKYIAPMRAYFSKFLPDPRIPTVRRVPPPPPESDDDEEEEDEKPVKGKSKLAARAALPVKSTQLGTGAPVSKNALPKAPPSGPGVHKTESKPAKPAMAPKAPGKAAAPKAKVAKPAPRIAAKAAKPAAKKPAPKKPAPKKPVAKKPAPAKKAGKPTAKKPAAKAKLKAKPKKR